ncbi:hypothetical protein LOTGIDRAFT_221243 [Lottia gigantea]|uniref:AD domain-containing protein n=1 Tax=Lottia gigantea TaxID=225164 RepID=V3Z517_LOTGI|nr:hypothetical protein LOTGIDRAFT_221243 [Lottia gigantea]ESO85798.1 hypothetical protein LOTGIDRAFT_221243 [Lottia gigantea]
MEESDQHPIFKTDPEEWMQLLYKQVSIITDNDVEHTGWVYTVDPVSQSYVLVQFTDEKIGLEIIPGHAVSKLTVLNNDSELHRDKLNSLFRPQRTHDIPSEEIKKRQLILKSWFEKNRLPVVVAGDELSISDALTIHPPYTPEDCVSSNEIILGRIQGLIKNMPKDHDEW